MAELAIPKDGRLPKALEDHVGYWMTFDTKRNRLIIFSFWGKSEESRESTALWAYELGKGWTDLSPSNSPQLSYSSFPTPGEIVYDPTGDRLLLFIIGEPPQPPPKVYLEPPPPPEVTGSPPISSDTDKRHIAHVQTWSFDFEKHSWQYLPVPQMPPSGNAGLLAVYDAKHGRVILLVGHWTPESGTNVPSETWAFDCQKNAWEKREALGSPGFNWLWHSSSLCYDSKRGEVLLVGEPSGLEEVNLRLWAYNYEGDTWEERRVINPPKSSRGRFALAYDDHLDVLIFFDYFIQVYNFHLNSWEKIESRNLFARAIADFRIAYDRLNQCELILASDLDDLKHYILTLKIEPEDGNEKMISWRKNRV
ncbi:MAG: hypothetical protein NTV33_11730 [Coprothermobacterota bacterium]|nr:hypothetical protein [Coprothermobacterota bacterium]